MHHSSRLHIKRKAPKGRGIHRAWLPDCSAQLPEVVTCTRSGSRHRLLSISRRPGHHGCISEAAGQFGEVPAGNVLRNEETRVLLSMLYVVDRSRRRSSVTLKYVEFQAKLKTQFAPGLAHVSTTSGDNQQAYSNAPEVTETPRWQVAYARPRGLTCRAGAQSGLPM